MRLGAALLTVVAALALVLGPAPAKAACQLQLLAELPVSMQGLRAVVEAKINGQDARFVVDSGAFFSSLGPADVAKYRLTLGPAPFGMSVRGVGGGEAQVATTTVKDFLFAGHLYHDVDFIVLESGPGSGIVGLLGQNVLGNADVEYDLAAGVVRLFKPQGCGFDDDLAYWAGSQPSSMIPIDPPDTHGARLRGEAMLNGVRIHVVLDTGSPRSLVMQTAAARAGVRPGDPGVVVVGNVTGVGERSFLQVWRGHFASFKIGGEEIRNQSLDFGDLQLADADMLLGADFFLSHRILVSNTQHKLYFTYNGGPVFNLGRPAQATGQPAPAASPGDAADLERQAQAMIARGDAPSAIADLTQAIALDAKEPRFYVERARAERLAREPLRAMDDFDAALTLQPDDVDALLGRARLFFAIGNHARGQADLDAAAAAAPSDPDERLAIGDLDMNQQAYAAAAVQFDLWLQANPASAARSRALKGACDARGMQGQQLDQALADCDAALKLQPGDPALLISRGLVFLRMGAADRALADYAAALKVAPGNGWALYGKGVAELRSGQTDKGNADIARAAQLTPTLPAEAKRLGLTP